LAGPEKKKEDSKKRQTGEVADKEKGRFLGKKRKKGLDTQTPVGTSIHLTSRGGGAKGRGGEKNHTGLGRG